MEWSQWLQDGPFLEVSFLLELKEEKKQTIQDIIYKLSKVTNKVEIVDKNVDEIIDFFDRGYPYDEEDPKSINSHSLKQASSLLGGCLSNLLQSSRAYSVKGKVHPDVVT